VFVIGSRKKSRRFLLQATRNPRINWIKHPRWADKNPLLILDILFNIQIQGEKKMHKLTRAIFAMFAVATLSVAALASSEVSDQKAGSLLVYNIYTSGAASGNAENTRINITNTSATQASKVHLFFVNESCQPADMHMCLTPNQTATFLTSDLDPGVRGYLVVVALDENGCPTVFNHLIGDEYVKFASGHSANLGAEAFAGIDARPSNCGTASTLVFNGKSIAEDDKAIAATYDMVPTVLAADSIPSRADGNDTLLIINRIGGSYVTGGAAVGALFGLVYDDGENVLSATFGTTSCQYNRAISGANIRTTPRIENWIPAGRTGWMKISSPAGNGLLGATINANATTAANAGSFAGGHNLHKLAFAPVVTLQVPSFPPGC
jgi:hypothetical protein